MAGWIFRKVDISEVPREVPRAFGVVAIPVAIALDGDGHVLGRLTGFVEPEEFRGQLLRLRGR